MNDHPKPLEFRSGGCAEFQDQLPELFSSGDVVEHPHLHTCKNCSSLVRDLEYIAEQAKGYLTEPVEPSETVWHNIELAIQQEAGAVAAPTRTKSR